MIPAELVLAVRGAAAVAMVTTLAGGIPRLVQLGLAIVLGLWAATIAHPPPLAGADAGAVVLVLAAARELAIGAALGVAAAVPLVAARTAGGLVDLAGARRAQGPYAALFGVLAAAVFVGIDGHVAVVRGVVDSYATMPPAVAVPGAHDLHGILDGLVAIVPAAVHLGLPWLVTAAVVEVAIGAGTRVANRAAAHVPAAAAAPAALVMITAALVGTLAVAIAALVRSAVG